MQGLLEAYGGYSILSGMFPQGRAADGSSSLSWDTGSADYGILCLSAMRNPIVVTLEPTGSLLPLFSERRE